MNPNLLDGEEQDNALAWLVDQQGYSVDDLKSAVLDYDNLGYETCREAHGTFLASVASELFDLGSVQGAVTVLATISLNDMAKLFGPQAELIMPKDTTIGIFAPWVGGGGAHLTFSWKSHLPFRTIFASTSKSKGRLAAATP